MEFVRPGVIRCGRMGQGVHLLNFLKTPRCKVVAVCDKNEPSPKGNTFRVETLPGKWSRCFAEEAGHFIDCVVDDKEPISSGVDGLKDLILMEEMHRKHRECC